MNIYLLVLPEGSTTTTPDLTHERVPRNLQLNDTSWALASDLGTAAEVGEALGLSGADERQQYDRTWVIFKLVEDGYFGYAVSSLWQKLAAWEAE